MRKSSKCPKERKGKERHSCSCLKGREEHRRFIPRISGKKGRRVGGLDQGGKKECLEEGGENSKPVFGKREGRQGPEEKKNILKLQQNKDKG